LISEPRVVLEGNGNQVVPIFVVMPRSQFAGSIPLTFAVRDSVSGKEKAIDVRFLGPE
jgi:hypothetical protein